MELNRQVGWSSVFRQEDLSIGYFQRVAWAAVFSSIALIMFMSSSVCHYIGAFRKLLDAD